jgi:hypothetical protein
MSTENRTELDEHDNGKDDSDHIEVIFGKPYPGESRHAKYYCNDCWQSLITIPIEIELDSTVHRLIKEQMLWDPFEYKDFQKWVNQCFKERMDQILTDPKEYGKATLQKVRSDYCLGEVSSE